MSSALSKYILATIVYYDVVDYPLTVFEIWKYLTTHNSETGSRNAQYFSLAAVLNELENENLKKIIETHRGFYFLPGRKNLVEQRMRRNKLAEEKYKRLLRVVNVLRFAPYIRMIAATGRLAMKNTEKKSDLDLLVVLEHGKIFTGRILVTLFVHLLGKRRHRGKIANRVCLNYFITTDSLEIGLKDIYSSSEYYFMVPLFDLGTFREFQVKNSWIKNYKTNYKGENALSLKALPDIFLAKVIRGMAEAICGFDFIENFLKKFQLRRIMKNPKTHQAGSMVIANNEALIFLPSPQGPKIYDKFQDRLNSLVKRYAKLSV